MHVASDSMYFSEEGHSLLFFLVTFPKNFQCGQLGHIRAVQVRNVLSDDFGLDFLSRLWFGLYRGFGYGLCIFQSLKAKDKESNLVHCTIQYKRKSSEMSVKHVFTPFSCHGFLSLNVKHMVCVMVM